MEAASQHPLASPNAGVPPLLIPALPFALSAILAPQTAPVPGTSPVFVVTVGGEPDAPPRSGRVLVYLIGPDAQVSPRAEPADAPFYEDPQPVFGIDVTGLKPGDAVRLDDAGTTGYPGAMADLTPGSYRVQAVLDWKHQFGSWRRETGNLFSSVATVQIGGDAPVALTLDRVVQPEAPRAVEGVEYVEVRSALLSDFRGEEVLLRAGVVKPLGHVEGEAYPAVYIVTGFGGDHTGAGGLARRRHAIEPATPEHTLASSAFQIVIDADGPYGHTLLADSANNGPVGRAVTEELIPALEQRFNLIARPEARLVTGHSSGGWTTLWLATEYPQVFGAAWSSAPDPVDFRAFQQIDIYQAPSMYTRDDGAGGVEPIPSYTEGGQVLMTVSQEIGVENAIGPRNTSGQQWHSWMAVFGPRAADGKPAALFDPKTGAIDQVVSAQFRKYDLTDRLRREPARYGPLFRERIRLVVGDADSYDLDGAVVRLQDALRAVWPQVTMEVPTGSITVVPGADHGTVYESEAMKGWPADMVGHLRRAGLPVRGE